MPTDFRTIEISNPNLTPANHRWITVHSRHLSGRGDISLYNTNSTAKPAPIVILLHGVYGSHWAWMFSGGAHRCLDTLKREQGLSDFVLVMPSDGLSGDGSGYLNRHSGSYEKWIMSDVIAAAQRAVPQINQKSSIYLCGLSMGGYGALRLGAKYSTTVSGISAHSAITDITEFQHFTDHSPIEDALEPQHDSSIFHWLKKHLKQLPPIRLDCGLDDLLLAGNRRFHQQLIALNIEHQYMERAGGHDWDYWSRQIKESLMFFDQIERSKNPP
ncbi:MAG: ATPase [Cellvibrionales bacterium]|nr:ATPase [Cellvibrionales bacterium]